MEALLSRQKFESRQSLNRSWMAKSDEMQAAITQVAIQAATMAVRLMRDADPPAEPYTRRTLQIKTSWTNDESASIKLEGTW